MQVRFRYWKPIPSIYFFQMAKAGPALKQNCTLPATDESSFLPSFFCVTTGHLLCKLQSRFRAENILPAAILKREVGERFFSFQDSTREKVDVIYIHFSVSSHIRQKALQNIEKFWKKMPYFHITLPRFSCILPVS